MKLHVLIACCAFLMIVANVNAAVYVKGGSRYPFPRPVQSNTGTLTKVTGNNKQSSHASSIVSNRRYRREASNFQSGIEGTPTAGSRLNHPAPQIQQQATVSSPPTHSAAADNHKQIDAGAVFEDQRPIDFDLNVRTDARFVPGIKSVSN